MDKLWILGDKFVYGSYNRYCFQQPEENFHIRKSHEVSGFMSNPDKSFDTNVVSRFRNLLIGTIADNPILPRIIVFVPNADLAQFYGHSKTGSSKGLAYIINWLMKEHNRIISVHKEKLPEKCKKAFYLQIVWIELPLHCNFNEDDQNLRGKFNTALREVGKLHENVSVLELKKVWNSNDDDLYSREHNRFTAEGYKTYWLAID